MRRRVVIGLAFLLLAGTAGAGAAAPKPGEVELQRFTFHSKLLRRNLHEFLLVPAGSTKGRQLVVYLHGYGQPTGAASDWMLPTLQELGAKAPIVLLVDDGNLMSWWHDRRTGKWGSYVLDELIPSVLRRTGADPTRVAIGGSSMGGFGALDLARLEPGVFCAVGGFSPALLTHEQFLAASDAFESEADYERHDLLSLARRLHLYFSPVYIDVGRTDSVRASVTAFVASLRNYGTTVRFTLLPGRGSGAQERMPTYLRWFVSACPRKS